MGREVRFEMGEVLFVLVLDYDLQGNLESRSRNQELRMSLFK
jgi:hypothetical protein